MTRLPGRRPERTFGDDTSGYSYTTRERLDEAKSIRDAVRVTVVNYMHHQLGWSLDQCDDRVERELRREIPRALFDELETSGWHLQGSTLLDVGAGQGGALLEAMERGAEAVGVEPGREFRNLTRMRLDAAGRDSGAIVDAPGERLPFADDSFDYVISLQVLEHVRDPGPVVREIFRVLKPGGRCLIACENYLSFREQHYRIRWLPMLPKRLGALYLRLIGRNPDFLLRHVFYTTYPRMWRIARRTGFENLTYEPVLQKLEQPNRIKGRKGRAVASLLAPLSSSSKRSIGRWLLHAVNVWRVGVRLHLVKPERK